MKEYAIWGIPKGKKDEELLLSKFEGEYIKYYGLAENLASLLRHKYHCKKVRIQEIDLLDNNLNIQL